MNSFNLNKFIISKKQVFCFLVQKNDEKRRQCGIIDTERKWRNGRRACFRRMCPFGREGSNPFFRIFILLGVLVLQLMLRFAFSPKTKYPILNASIEPIQKLLILNCGKVAQLGTAPDSKSGKWILFMRGFKSRPFLIKNLTKMNLVRLFVYNIIQLI